ncbi:MAG: phosphoribosylformylglycinamidine synthase II [Candidatus Altiarchaeales archaeon IMC4]|nr:MAG: phosphoribosylformylglycinamidine synthase II [Candidatus Altiarchaeales archaeon IMC4]
MVYKEIAEGVYEIDILGADDKELDGISTGRCLGLSRQEMLKIKAYFKGEGRNPTDVELEALAQSWSEHCCYKSSRPVLEKTVFCINAPQNICVISEDAAIVDFDEEYAYVVALESHNHPSALDPYGGAATGIGGILRDVVCMGAQPVALVDPIFFGPLDFPEGSLPKGTKRPKYLFQGVVKGIADYGNRVGIPTVAGMVAFDESYVGNCLVNVGCIGMVRKDKVTHSRAGAPGDVYIVAGGKTGRDGIHGVTFASAELSRESEKDIPAVQLGYAIMKEPLIHACLEVNDKGLITGMKDFGGGGLSCVSSEMAHAGGMGATVNLDEIPLKEKGIKPWEIWVSESQERMMLAARPENARKVLEVFDFWDVPAGVIGAVDGSSRIKATYKGKTVLDLDLEFLNKGVRYERKYKVVERNEKDPAFDMPDLNKAVLDVLGSASVGSRESVIRRYDHEVRAATVLKPMQGIINHETHGDAAVIKPLEKSFRGLAITADVNPRMCRQNPYWGSASAVDEVIRNLTAVNAAPHSMADCLNFGNPEKEEIMGDFVSACEGLYFAANGFGVPFVSGNVSLYNESSMGPVAPTPALMGVGIVEDVRQAISSDIKEADNSIYLVGQTEKELGGSQYYRTLGLAAGVVPRVQPGRTKKDSQDLRKSMGKGIVRSCHDLSEGGLIVAIAEMCFGGNLGAKIDLTGISGLRTDFKMFSESNGRWLVEVKKGDEKEFERIVDARRIGAVTKEKNIVIIDSNIKLNLPLDELRSKWSSAVEPER